MFPENSDDYSKKKRRSRWGGSEHEKIFIPGMPTILPSNLNKDQEQAYLRKYFLLRVLYLLTLRLESSIVLMVSIY